MRISSLEAFGIHPALLAVWQTHYGGELLPIQARAVQEGGVLAGASLVVNAPTGSGKTLVGELGALQAATRGRRVLYLVPTKALAEAKYAHLSALYGPLGIRAAIATRDRRSSDAALSRGDFDLAVAVPEKARALLMRAPQLAAAIGCVVIDELQLVGDPQRGPCLEGLLARLLAGPASDADRTPAQFIGLSATLHNARELADWLGATALESAQRPVELRKGVVCSGVFTYLEHNAGRAGEEVLWQGEDSADDPLLALVTHFARLREPTLVFVRDRQTCLALAERIATRCPLPPADEALAALAELAPTALRGRLRGLLEVGVAFHNADLQFEERQVIERAFAAGQIGALCATSTLAMGVNLPARNVILDDQRWAVPSDGGRPTLVPLSRAEFENMGGRAGRLQFGEEFGRAILLAESPLMRDALLQRYVTAPFAPLRPALARLRPIEQVMELCAIDTGAGLVEAYCRTLGGRLDGRRDRLPQELCEAIEEARHRGLVCAGEHNGAIISSSFGKLCAASGTSVESFAWLRERCERFATGWPDDIEALTIAALCPEARSLSFPASPGELRERDYCEALRRVAAERGLESVELGELLRCPTLDLVQRRRASKLVLMMLRWMSAEPTAEIEQELGLPAGRLETLGEALGWLVQVIAELGPDLGWPSQGCDRLRDAAAAVAAGLPPELAELAALRRPGVARERLLEIAATGVRRPCEMTAEQRRQLRSEAEDVEQHATVSPVSEPAPPTGPAITPADEGLAPMTEGPLLQITERHPDLLTCMGATARVGPAEYKLMRALAERPGECVSYETLYNAIWDRGEIVEPAQLHWHKHNLVRKLTEATAGAASALIETVPRRGYRLRLRRREVALE